MKLFLIHKETKEFIYPLSRNKVFIKVEFAFRDKYEIKIVYWKRFRNHTKKSKQMQSINFKSKSNYYFTTLEFDDSIRYLNYNFEILYENQLFYYSPEGITTHVPEKFFELQSINQNDIFKTPHDFEGNVGYHIFPERFNNGDSKNDPKDTVSWNSVPTRDNFFGGDFKGIKEKIPYLKELGIKTIFLTPIFKSFSNHKYDTIDYYKLDEMFGNKDDFKKLVLNLHNNNFKLILDGVFNHIGFYSNIFQDVIKKGPKSKYWNWFIISEDYINLDPINYECVGDYKWMPKLNSANKDVQKYFIKVALFWIRKYKINGWRLDVGDELDNYFRKKLRFAIKQKYPESLIVSETWHNGIDLLRGDEVDSIMNYRLRDSIIDYLGKKDISTNTFINQIESIYFDYPVNIHHILYNLLDSHDTERFLTTINENYSLYELAIILQVLLPGMPVLYYGNETGMVGKTDPLCRAGMNWNDINLKILSFYKKIISLKNDFEAFKFGEFQILNLNNKIFSFLRKYQQQQFLVCINKTSDIISFTLDKETYSHLNLQNNLDIFINPRSYLIHDISI